MQILLCAATRWEYAALAGLGNHRATLLQTGMGPQATTLALKTLAPDASFGCAVSVGLAGALQEGMKSGDLVADLRGCDLEIVQAAREIAQRRKRALHLGPIAHSNVLLSDFAQKSAFAAKHRACAVDMETQALRVWSQERDIPIIAVRAVLDALHDAVPPAPTAEDAATLTRYAVQNWRNLPLGFVMGLKARRALAGLALFLKEFLPKI